MPQPRKTEDDPTVTSASMTAGPDYPEGTHPARKPSEVHHSADRITYRDADDKPDKSSVVQVAEVPADWYGDTSGTAGS